MARDYLTELQRAVRQLGPSADAEELVQLGWRRSEIEAAVASGELVVDAAGGVRDSRKSRR